MTNPAFMRYSSINIRESLVKSLVAQFKQPHGWLGHLAGITMANRPSNKMRNDWTLDLLNLQATDRVLEIGFGPGMAIQKASQIVTEGVIIGIDHSETMLQQASRRNRAAIAAGRVKLYLSAMEQWVGTHEPFDKIFSANVVQFWDDPVAEFRKLHQYLSPRGLIATTFQPRYSGATDHDAIQMGNHIIQSLKAANFSFTMLKVQQIKPVAVICALGSNATIDEVQTLV